MAELHYEALELPSGSDWESETGADDDVAVDDSLMADLAGAVSSDEEVAEFEDSPSELADALNADAPEIEDAVVVSETTLAEAPKSEPTPDDRALVKLEPEIVEAEIIREESEAEKLGLSEQEFEQFMQTPQGQQIVLLLQKISAQAVAANQAAFQEFHRQISQEVLVLLQQFRQEREQAQAGNAQALQAAQANVDANPNAAPSQSVNGLLHGLQTLAAGSANLVTGAAHLGAKSLSAIGSALRSYSAADKFAEQDVGKSEDARVAQGNHNNISEGMAGIYLGQEDIPSNMQYRMSSMLAAEEDYLNGVDELWRAKQMQDVLHKVEEYADAHGLSKQDVISRINSDASVKMTELNNAFNQAMEHDPDARAAKAKLDRSLNEWMNHHENLTEDFAFADPGNKRHQEAFEQYQKSERTVQEATEIVPKTTDEELSHMARFREFMENMKEKIAELARRVSEKVMGFFGRTGHPADMHTSLAP